MNQLAPGHVYPIVSETPTTPTRVDRQLAASVAVQLTLLAVLFLFFPHVMAIVFAVLSLWLALAAWFDSHTA